MDLQTLLAGSLRAIHRLGYKVDLVQEQPAPNSDALILPLGGAWLVITDMSETPAPEFSVDAQSSGRTDDADHPADTAL